MPMVEVLDNIDSLRQVLSLPEDWLPDERSEIGKRCRRYLAESNQPVTAEMHTPVPSEKPAIEQNQEVTEKMHTTGAEKHGVIKTPERRINDLNEKFTLSPKAKRLRKWLLRHPGSTVSAICRGLKATVSGKADAERLLTELGAEEVDGRWVLS